MTASVNDEPTGDDNDATTSIEDDVPRPGGQTMFSARQLPWMKIGKVIDTDVTSAEAAQIGGIDFEVELRDAGHRDVDGEWKVVRNRRSVVRKDTDEWYSFVSDEYKVVNYSDAFEFMDGINPRYVAAGALSNGRQAFMIVQLPDNTRANVVVNGSEDPHDMYVVLRTSHDLSKAIEVAVMMLRGRCMNQLTLPSFTANVQQKWGIRHVGDPHQKLQQAQESLKKAEKYKESFEHVATQLASVSIDERELERILERILPQRARRSDQITAIVNQYTSDDTIGFVGTGWGAVNAVSGYFQWGRSMATRTDQSMFTSPLAGDTAKYVNRTAHLVMSRA